MEDGLLVAL